MAEAALLDHEQELLLAAEVVVEAGEADPGAPRQVADRGVVVAFLGEDLRGHVEQPPELLFVLQRGGKDVLGHGRPGLRASARRAGSASRAVPLAEFWISGIGKMAWRIALPQVPAGFSLLRGLTNELP